jgi:hypothetical protein
MSTYLELLAHQDAEAREGFDESAKDLFVSANEYEEDIGPEDHHPDELEDQSDFQKFGGSHQAAYEAPPPPKFSDLTKQSVLYQKKIRTHVVNVDSRFRDNPRTPLTPAGSLSTDYVWKLPFPIRNVISVRVSSIELPNTSYDFSDAKGNTKFYITYPVGPNSSPKTFMIPEGNYTDITDLCGAMETLINDGSPVDRAPDGGFPSNTGTFSVTFDTVTGKITISHSSNNNPFSIGFVDSYPDRAFEWGLGYNLGFNGCQPTSLAQRGAYTGNFTYTGENVVDVIGPNYFILKLDPDWVNVEHHSLNKNYIAPGIAKIVVNVPKNAVIYDNGSNTVFKEITFQQPTNVSSFPVQLLEPDGDVVNLEGANFSFTLEVVEAVDPALYDHIRTNGTSP